MTLVIAAFTMLGYLIAGLRGRRHESGLKTAGWVLGTSLTFSILTAVLRDFLSGPEDDRVIRRWHEEMPRDR